jgi:CheY-like chemotaxis protein
MAKILLVEDDKSLSEIYAMRLRAENYEIVSAGDGEEALALAIKERPDLIVSDVMMPKISGFDMLDILRSTTETKDIKVIMMTALSSEDQRARGEALGADRYLVKSQVGIEDVVRTVHDVLGDGVGGTAPVAPAVEAPVAPAQESVPAVPALEVHPAPEFTLPAPSAPVAPQPEMAAPPQPPTDPITPVIPAAPAFNSEPLVEGPTFEEPTTPQPDLTQQVPAAAPVVPAPVAPEALIATPAQEPAPTTPAPAFTLPEPTAPFSSNPPASLGDRIIHPLPSADALNGTGVTDLSAQMSQELSASLEQLQVPPAEPTAQAPQVDQQPVAPPQPAPQPPTTPPLPPQQSL